MTCVTSARFTPALQMTVQRGPVLVPTLGLVVLTVAVLQTAVVPVLDVIARQLGAAESSVSWVVTANLLAAAATTPLIGRLADLRNKKRVLLGVLAMVFAGSVIGAVSTSLPLLLAGRVLQGSAFALYPVAVSILRDEVPADRLVRSIAVLSAMLGLGGGLGLVVTGLLMTPGASYHRVFAVCTLFTATVAVIAAIVVPNRTQRVTGSIDWAGAIGLAAALSALLLAGTQGRGWGWLAPATIGSAAVGITVMRWWWRRSERCAAPLVSTSMLRQRPVLIANGATLLVGMGLYFSFLGLTGFVEAPTADGFGFGASVLDASVEFLLPGALAAAATALVSGRLIERFGAQRVVMAGAAAGVLGFAFLFQWHSAPWQVIVAGLLTNAYVSLAYGALPVLVVGAVRNDETAVATSLNAIVRMVGAAIAAALVAALVAPGITGHVGEAGFAAVFALGAITAAAALLLVGRISR